MDLLKISVVTLLSLCVDLCLCQYFTSSFEIENLLNTERKLIDRFNDYIKRQTQKGMTFDSDVLNFINDANHRNREVNRDHDFDNPITTFHIVRRAVQDWTKLKENLTCTEDPEHSECPILTGADVYNVVMKESGSKWPTEVDLHLAVDAILNVQNVYNLTIDDLRKGKIGMAVVQPLSADDIFFIANAAKDSGKIYEAVHWLEYLIEHVEEFSSRDFTTGTLYRRLAASYSQRGMKSRAVTILEEYLQKEIEAEECKPCRTARNGSLTSYPNDKGVSRDLTFLKSSQHKETTDEPTDVLRFVKKSTIVEERLKYENICRSALEVPKITDPSLYCLLRPLFRSYGTSKTEILAWRPRVELVYEVVGASEADKFLTLAEKSMGKKNKMFPLKQMKKSSQQALESGPLCEHTDKLLVNLTSRLEQITNFQMYLEHKIHSSECYTVVNEGLGSVQNFVMNAWPKDHTPYPFSGNRLATIILQLSDVQFGGQIVFPRINLAVPVVKGSAVLWWNLKRDGLPDPKSVYIKCPTVVGSNWVAVKQILSHSQMFRRGCEATRR